MSEFNLQNRTEASITSQEQLIINQIHSWLGNSNNLIIAELPPIYAYFGCPGATYEGQNSDSKPNKAGFNFGMVLHSKLFKNTNIRWSHMIDDVNGRCNEQKEQFAQVHAEYEAIQRTDLDTLYFESKFYSSSTSTCSQMDALFQMTKVETAVSLDYMPGKMPNCKFLVIHPDSFVYAQNPNAVKRSQQESMLNNLANNLTTYIHLNNLYKLPDSISQKGIRQARLNYSKKAAIEFITNTYRWITYDDEGNLGFARASWNEKVNRFEITRRESLDLVNDGQILSKAVY